MWCKLFHESTLAECPFLPVIDIVEVIIKNGKTNAFIITIRAAMSDKRQEKQQALIVKNGEKVEDPAWMRCTWPRTTAHGAAHFPGYFYHEEW